MKRTVRINWTAPDTAHPFARGWARVVREVYTDALGAEAFEGPYLPEGCDFEVPIGAIVVEGHVIKKGRYFIAYQAVSNGLRTVSDLLPSDSFDGFRSMVAGMVGMAREAGTAIPLQANFRPCISRERAVAIASETFLTEPLPETWLDLPINERLHWLVAKQPAGLGEPPLKLWEKINRLASRIEDVSLGKYAIKSSPHT